MKVNERWVIACDAKDGKEHYVSGVSHIRRKIVVTDFRPYAEGYTKANAEKTCNRISKGYDSNVRGLTRFRVIKNAA